MMKLTLSCFCILLMFVSQLNAQINSKNPPDEKVSILLGHRYSGGFNPHDYEQYNFTGLFKVNGKYYLKPTKVKIKSTIDECSNDSIFSINAKEKGECLYFFWGFDKHPRTALNVVPIRADQRYIMPKDVFEFKFNNQQYAFTAEGDVTDNSVKNYKLFYVDKKTDSKQLLVNEELLEDSQIEILFIGDLDGDNKPDFIINAPPHYEARNILLFMSSAAENGELVNCTSQQFDWFDC